MKPGSDMLLSIDTSSAQGVLALGSLDGGVLYHRTSNIPNQHSLVLLPFIQELLIEADISLMDLSGISVVTGPGSFVGVRLALSVTQGLAYALKLLVWPISGLQVLAQQAFLEAQEKLHPTPHPFSVNVCRNAHMGDCYYGEYQENERGVMEATRADFIEKIDPKIEISDRLPSPKALHQVASDALQYQKGVPPESLSIGYLRGNGLWKQKIE
jgi:tRNA threonylcarbamoyladenosine biosynthesis protein TsaB